MNSYQRLACQVQHNKGLITWEMSLLFAAFDGIAYIYGKEFNETNLNFKTPNSCSDLM
jgi:hypothetical protein